MCCLYCSPFFGIIFKTSWELRFQKYSWNNKSHTNCTTFSTLKPLLKNVIYSLVYTANLSWTLELIREVLIGKCRFDLYAQSHQDIKKQAALQSVEMKVKIKFIRFSIISQAWIIGEKDNFIDQIYFFTLKNLSLFSITQWKHEFSFDLPINSL